MLYQCNFFQIILIIDWELNRYITNHPEYEIAYRIIFLFDVNFTLGAMVPWLAVIYKAVTTAQNQGGWQDTLDYSGLVFSLSHALCSSSRNGEILSYTILW